MNHAQGRYRGADGALQSALATETTDPYDSHPSLPERCAALEGVGSTSHGDARPAIALLNDLPADVTARLQAMTPATYTGIASALVERYL